MGQKACCQCDADRDNNEATIKRSIPAMTDEDDGDKPLDAFVVSEESPGKEASYFEREAEQLKELKAGSVIVKDGEAFTFTTGAVYKGQWKDGMRDGVGQQTWPDGACYSGQWVANRAEGMGKFLHSDGDFYIGEWSGNMANGIGKYYHKGSTTYAGQWKKDMQDGYGVETWIEGARYEGSFIDGQKHGHGIYRWTDGSIYEGSWTDNVIDGPGCYLANDGRSFKGQWSDSMIHGMGRYEWPGGRWYGGQYVNDQKDGFGSFSLSLCGCHGFGKLPRFLQLEAGQMDASTKGIGKMENNMAMGSTQLPSQPWIKVAMECCIKILVLKDGACKTAQWENGRRNKGS
eukprot:symbB.v1.2.007283.t1/scaffold438.1/size205425/11